jgi:hypothetical protein
MKKNYIFFIALLLGLNNVFSINAPNQSSPANAANVFTGLSFNWDAVVGCSQYQFQVDTSSLFNSPVLFNITKNYINSSSLNSDTEHYLENLFFGTNYHWRVRCYISGDTSIWQQRTFTTSNTLTHSSPANNSLNNPIVTLNWLPHTGVDFYDVQMDTSLSFSSPALKAATKTYINSTDGNFDTQHSFDDLFFGTNYFWRVRARNTVDTTNWTSNWQLLITDTMYLSSPASNSVTSSGLTLNWSPNPGVDFYELQVDTNSSFNSNQFRTFTKTYINSTDGNSDTQHYLEDLFFSQKYFWRVRSFNLVDTTKWSQVWNFTTNNLSVLSSPVTGSVSWVGLTLDWAPNTAVDFYDLQIDTNINFNTPLLRSISKSYINSTNGNSDTQHYIDELLFGQRYFWRVRSRNLVDTTVWSEVWNFTTRDLVNLASPLNNSQNWSGLTLDWNPHPGADFYDVQIDTTDSFNSNAFKSVSKTYINSTDGNSDTQHFFDDLYFGVNYHWRVRARNLSDTSEWFQSWTFSTRDFVTHSSPASNTNQWTGLTLDWLPHTGVDFYDIQVDTSNQFNSPALKFAFKNYTSSSDGNADTYHFVDDLFFGKTYYWRVRARNLVDTTSWSTQWTFNTNDYVTLSSPAEAQLNVATTGTTLNWLPHTSVDAYHLQIDTTNIFTSPITQNIGKAYISSSDGNTDTQHSSGTLLSNKVYFWRVRAANAVDTSAWTTRSLSTGSVPIVYPSITNLISPTNGFTNQVNGISFSWSTATNANAYEFQISLNPDFVSPYNSQVLSSTSLVLNNLPTGKYYWRVRAIRNMTIYSNWSPIRMLNQCLRTFSNYNLNVCGGLFWNGKNRNQTGTYIDTIPNVNGCDSIIQLQLIVRPTKYNFYEIRTCDSYFFNGESRIYSGRFYDTLQTSLGCDSIVAIDLYLSYSSTSTKNINSCGPVNVNGKTYTSSGIYKDTLLNATNCDSIITLNISIVNSYLTQLNESACGTFKFGNRILTQSGFYVDSLKSVNNCDSIVSLILTLKSSTFNYLNASTCNEYLFNNKLLKQSGIYRDTLTGVNTCDSIVVLELTIKQATNANFTIQSCGDLVFRNKIYTSSGIYFDTLTNAQFCDSIIKIDLSIIRVDTSVTQNSNLLIANATNANYQWLRCGFGLISGANQKSFIPSVSGEYSVVVNQQNCIDTSACYLVAVTGIQNTFADENVLVYPNPTSGLLNVEMRNSVQDYDIKLFAVDGKSIEIDFSKKEQSIQMDLSGLKSGIYFLQILNKSGSSFFYKLNKN